MKFIEVLIHTLKSEVILLVLLVQIAHGRDVIDSHAQGSIPVEVISLLDDGKLLFFLWLSDFVSLVEESLDLKSQNDINFIIIA